MPPRDPKEPVVVGYWSRSPDDTSLPYPQANAANWQGQEDFTVRLKALETAIKERRSGKLNAYRGFSMCRLCAIPNGSEEYEWGGFRWPSGLLHYIEAHSVRPPDDFLQAILGSAA